MQKCSDRINIWAIYSEHQMVECLLVGLICRTMCRKITAIQDVALFSKGYIEDYPVFIWNTDDGLLVLGLSHRTATRNSPAITIPLQTTSTTPHLCVGDAWLGFAVPLFSLLLFQTQNHSQYRTDCRCRCETLADGKASFTSYQRRTIGNCKQCKQSFFHFEVGKMKRRANWISGVSHDIRTPLSMIMGYAGRIAAK
ncbi:MAG: hypothetical protein ACLUUW_00175 [Blautia wexlerae]